MVELTPIFTQLDKEIVYDTSIEESIIQEVICDKSLRDFNQANTQLKFSYPGDFIYYLASPDSG